MNKRSDSLNFRGGGVLWNGTGITMGFHKLVGYKAPPPPSTPGSLRAILRRCSKIAT